MEAIKRLQQGNIFKEDSIVESVVKKELWGSPVYKNVLLRVKQSKKDYCICEEPNELAAVYGLGPKTARFKRRKSE